MLSLYSVDMHSFLYSFFTKDIVFLHLDIGILSVEISLLSCVSVCVMYWNENSSL